MTDGGRIRHHIKNNIGNKKNTILMVGYAEPRSLGGKLLAGNKSVRIFREDHDVAAEVKQLFLVHGEYEVQQNFAVKLREKGFKHIEIPEYHQEFEI